MLEVAGVNTDKVVYRDKDGIYCWDCGPSTRKIGVLDVIWRRVDHVTP